MLTHTGRLQAREPYLLRFLRFVGSDLDLRGSASGEVNFD